MDPLALSVAQAAEALSVSPDTVRRLINQGQIRTICVSELRRILVSDLRDYLERQAQDTVTQPLTLRPITRKQTSRR